MDDLEMGDIVRFARVVDPGDAESQMVLLDDPDGGRVLVLSLGTGKTFPPRNVFPVGELIKVASVATRLANEFSSLLLEELGSEVIVQIIERNTADGDPRVCHSHDFLDANMVMAEAWRTIFGFEINLQSDRQRRMWGRAWDIAKTNNFHEIREEWNSGRLVTGELNQQPRAITRSDRPTLNASM
jgi:hypothetical protein